MSSTLFRVVAGFAVFAAATLVTSCGNQAPGGAHPSSQDQPVISGEPAGYNAQDVAFANNMIQNHRQGIDLSAPVPDRSTNPKVVAFAVTRSSALQSDVEVLKVMLVQWNENPTGKREGNGSSSSVPGLVDQATIARLRSLRGGTFDTLWLQSMIALDQGAIEIANVEIAGKHNDDAMGLARQIVAARQSDIGTMKQLLGS